eukprot:g3628.t1
MKWRRWSYKRDKEATVEYERPVGGAAQRMSSKKLCSSSRWRSTLKRLMKDVSGSIDHIKRLRGRENYSKEVDSELTLAAASAQRLSLHVNAWTTPELSKELERIWLQAVRAEANIDPHFQHLVTEWERASEDLEKFISTTHAASVDGEAEQNAMATKIRHCQLRAGIEPKAEKAGWWKQRQIVFLWDELRHIERKVAPVASRSRLAARYNLLLARCAEAGAWTTAVSAYQSIRSRGIVPKEPQNKREVGGPFSLEPFVYQHLLRAAKNASPPQPRAALLVLREMRLRGEEPAATHYNLVVSACARAAAVAASASTLKPLAEAVRGVDGENRNPMKGSASNAQRDIDLDGGIEAAESVPLEDGNAGLSDGSPSKRAPSADGANDENGLAYCDSINDICLLSAGSKAMKSRQVEHAGDAWRLALEVIADMRGRGIAPTEVTFKTLVECCRCAAAAPSPTLTSVGGEVKGSSPAEVYAALKEAGVPLRFCYQAGLRNALKGERCFPEYVAELSR